MKFSILNIPCTGSIQNPAWSPDGQQLCFTQWHKGYNKGPASVFIFDLSTGRLDAIANDGATNVSEPGSNWRGDCILFSSDKGRDEDWTAYFNLTTRRSTYLPDRPHVMGYEPSWNKDGSAIVFEQHPSGDEANSRVVIHDLASGKFQDITSSGDRRQPNWSNDGKLIVWQSQVGEDKWQLELYDVSAKTISKLAMGTDATFGPDNRVLYSDEDGALRTVDRVLFNREGRYAGAPSWSPDGKRIAFETCVGDADGSAGTKIAVIDL